MNSINDDPGDGLSPTATACERSLEARRVKVRRTPNRLSVALSSAISLVLTASVHAQEREQLVAISAYVDVRVTNYTQAPLETALVFGDVPISIAVRIGNNTNTELKLGSVEREWSRDVRVQLQRTVSGQPQDVQDVRVVVSRPPSPRLSVPAGRGAGLHFDVSSASGGSLDPGRYLATITLENTGLEASLRRFNNILTRTVAFEVREVMSEGELLDEYLQRSYEGLRKGDLTEMRRWLTHMLSRHPNSLPALMDLASAAVRDGDCASALPLLKRAQVVASTNGDVQLIRQADGHIMDIIKTQQTLCSK